MKSFFSKLRLKNLEMLVIVAFVFIFSFVLQGAALNGRNQLKRFPDIHGNTIVFVYGEDIWAVPAKGGIATRLTINDGQERFPKFSNDGKMIAFTGDYDGNSDVYVMNSNGGKITRVTFHPGYDEVIGWHPVKNKIIFWSTRDSYSRFSRLYLISPDGTGIEEMIMHEAAAGSFSPDGSKMAYNRVRREHRTWKRYKGGLAQDIYLYDFKTKKDARLTKFRGTDRIPMWIGDSIYFSSDRDGVLNIYEYNTKTSHIKQITKHADYDVRRPSEGVNRIVYEKGGELWVLNVNSKETEPVAIKIIADAPEVRPYIKKVKKYITGFDISPSGKRALIEARGEIFTVPEKYGPTRNLTEDSGARDKDAVWSPDGKKIAYFSDKGGEYEIYITDPKGLNKALCLTHNKDGYRHTLRWSPDSKKIAFTDQTLTCYYIDIATKKIHKVDKAYYENIDVSLDLKPIYDFTWSPDSRFIAYSKMNKDLVTSIYIYSLDTGKTHCVSNAIFNDFGPVFSKDGEHLFFISNRRFNPTYCDFEWEMVYKNVAGIYCLTLKKNGKPILPFKSDEESCACENSKKQDLKKKKHGKKEEKSIKALRMIVDFEGISERIETLPLKPGNYRNLSVNKDSIFYLNADKGDFNRFEFRRVGPKNLYTFSINDRKEKTVMTGIDGYKLSFDGSHIVYKKRNSIGIIKSNSKNSKGKALNLSDLKMRYEPLKEWEQIFNEAWRMERDFYYEPNMHGVSWKTMKEKYGRLMQFASCRQDVQYIIGELIGELNTSHTYVFGGDRKRKADRVNIGMLGVDWEIDKVSNRYRFKKIYKVTDWSRVVIPPLMKPGININKGDYILKVNDKNVTADKNIYSYFQDLAGKQVTLLVNKQPTRIGAKEIVVKPQRGERLLRYLDWVEHNRLLIEKASKGQIGYIHLPDTYNASAVEFPKYFYAQTRKKGLIIDGRYNGGGLDPDIFLGRLDKKIHSYWTRRYSHDQTSPSLGTRAHMVLLTNRQAGSGGDELPMIFRLRKMGPIIGTRTWGGLVGVSMFIRMIDGGGLTAPDYRIYGTKGNWVVENVGIKPDITVDLDPNEMARGYDAQLMKGIEVLMKEIKRDSKPWPKHEIFPIDKEAK